MKNTLKKILTELNSENPRLDYIKGMLEVLIGEDEGEYLKADGKGNVQITTNEKELDEASILDNKAKAHIERFGMPQQND